MVDPNFMTSKAPPDFFRPTKAGKTSDRKGRGVVAARDIKKGEMIYGQTTNYAYFSNCYGYQHGTLYEVFMAAAQFWTK